MENQEIQFKVNGTLYGRLAIFKVMKLNSGRTKSNITNKTWWGGKRKKYNLVTFLSFNVSKEFGLLGIIESKVNV